MTGVRPMRVMFLEPSALVTGGAIALLRLVSALDRTRIRPLVVLGSEGPLVTEFQRIPGCRVLCKPMPAALARVTRNQAARGALGGWSQAASYAVMLRRIAAAWQPDVIHSNGLKTHLLSMALARGRAVLVWHIRDYVAPPYMPGTTAAAIRLLARRVPQIVICNSAATRAALRPALDAAGPAVHTIPDGVDCRAFLSASVLPHRRPRVVLLGRIAEWKGHHVFIDAARRLLTERAEALFVIAGGATSQADGEFERRLRRDVIRDGLTDRVRFAGVVRDVPALLHEADILVHCSTSPEPFGQVIIEAMAAGVPVIATGHGAPATMIVDGVDGRLVPPGDSAALAHAIRGLLENPALRNRLAQAGARTVRHRYSIDRTARRIAATYLLPRGRVAAAAH